jgi:hypothetical protein
MTLSNRLWRAIAARMDDSPTQAMVWAKVRMQAHGKRHYLREIDLTHRERGAVACALHANTADDYLRFCVVHERNTNPDFAL